MVKFHSSVTFSPSIPLTFPGGFFIQWIAEKGKRVLVRGLHYLLVKIPKFMVPVVLEHSPDTDGHSAAKLNQKETQRYIFCNMQNLTGLTTAIWAASFIRRPKWNNYEFVVISFCFLSAEVIDRLLLDTSSSGFKGVFLTLINVWHFNSGVINVKQSAVN